MSLDKQALFVLFGLSSPKVNGTADSLKTFFKAAFQQDGLEFVHVLYL
jgi:hypothetical protein